MYLTLMEKMKEKERINDLCLDQIQKAQVKMNIIDDDLRERENIIQ